MRESRVCTIVSCVSVYRSRAWKPRRLTAHFWSSTNANRDVFQKLAIGTNGYILCRIVFTRGPDLGFNRANDEPSIHSILHRHGSVLFMERVVVYKTAVSHTATSVLSKKKNQMYTVSLEFKN